MGCGSCHGAKPRLSHRNPFARGARERVANRGPASPKAGDVVRDSGLDLRPRSALTTTNGFQPRHHDRAHCGHVRQFRHAHRPADRGHRRRRPALRVVRTQPARGARPQRVAAFARPPCGGEAALMEYFAGERPRSNCRCGRRAPRSRLPRLAGAGGNPLRRNPQLRGTGARIGAPDAVRAVGAANREGTRCRSCCPAIG